MAQRQSERFRTTQETPITRERGRVTNFTLSFLLSPAVSSNAALMWEIKKSECVNISLHPTALIYFLPFSFPSVSVSFFLFFSSSTVDSRKQSAAVCVSATTTPPPTRCHQALVLRRVFVCVCRPGAELATLCVRVHTKPTTNYFLTTP